MAKQVGQARPAHLWEILKNERDRMSRRRTQSR